MDIEYIKEGKKYKLELLCIHNKEKVIVFETPTGDHLPLRIADLECVSPENGIKNTEPAPKYDPNRKFRKGDIVKPCQVKGRWHSVSWMGRSGIHFTVTEDEDENGIVSIKDPDCKLPYITAAVFFELVTPVEELEPYFVMELKGAYGVYNTRFQPETEVCHFFTDIHPHAKEAAEAECARLNAEHRKDKE